MSTSNVPPALCNNILRKICNTTRLYVHDAEYFRLLFSLNLREDLEEFRNKIQDDIIYLLCRISNDNNHSYNYLQVLGLTNEYRDTVIDSAKIDNISDCYNLIINALDSPIANELVVDYRRHRIRDLSTLYNKLRYERNKKTIDHMKEKINASNIIFRLSEHGKDPSLENIQMIRLYINIISHYLSIESVPHNDTPVLIEELNNTIDFIKAYQSNPDDPDIFEFFMPV